MLAVAAILPEGGGSSHVLRSFFGVHRIVDSPDGTFRQLMHGTTTHGARRLLSDSGQPLSDIIPATYYYAQSPMARSVDIARDHVIGRHGLKAGVVGLGAGAIACAARAGDTWSFYEIDQVVVDIARDPEQFGFLSHCQPQAAIVVGDARLSLVHENAGAFDYLLIDAFSSDAIPTHLMTAEAFRLYLSKLAPTGVLAIHISNRHLDLAPVVAAGLATIPGANSVLVIDKPKNPGYDTAPSRVVLVSRDEAVLKSALGLSGADRLEPTAGVTAWTDDYSDIFSALMRSRSKNKSATRESAAH
jgi:hypothetical protein